MIKNYTHDWLLLVAAYHASSLTRSPLSVGAGVWGADQDRSVWGADEAQTDKSEVGSSS